MEKQHALNAAITASQDVHHNIDSLLNWVNDTEVSQVLCTSRLEAKVCVVTHDPLVLYYVN